MCDWVTLLYNRKLTEHCIPAMMEKIKTILKKDNREPSINPDTCDQLIFKKEARIYNKKKTVFSANDTRKTGQPYENQWNWNTPPHLAQK